MFIFCPEKQRGSPARRGRKPGLVPSSPHTPSAPLLPAPPAWTSAPETATDSSRASPLTPKKAISPPLQLPLGCPDPPHPLPHGSWVGEFVPVPATTEVTGGGRDAGAGGLSPSLPAGVCSPPCLPPGCYQSLLRKDSTQDSSRSDFRVCSAPPIKPQAARREDKQSPLSPINGPSAPRAPRVLASERSRTQGQARTDLAGGCASRAECSEEDGISPSVLRDHWGRQTGVTPSLAPNKSPCPSLAPLSPL